MTTRPRLSFVQIWNMCFGFIGIQFGFALQNSNASRIFQTLGAGIDDIPMLWIAAPLTGLLVQPIVGHYSDRTWGALGRRRPFFLAGAIFAALALVAMPYAPMLWIAACLLWLLDASINVSLGPLRALAGDLLPSSQRASGYAMQTFFIGAGAVIASALPWALAQCGVDNVASEGRLPDTVKFAFGIGAVVLFGAIGWTVYASREYPPDALAAFDDAIPQAHAPLEPSRARRAGSAWLVAGIAGLLLVYATGVDRQLYVLACGLLLYGATLLAAAHGRRDGVLAQIVADAQGMPPVMRRLATVQLFSWFALFAMWIYTTAAVTQTHFGATDTHSTIYNEGANWVGVLFAAYNGFAALAAIGFPWMTRRIGLRSAHAINLALGGAGLLSFLVVRDPHWLLLSMVGVGFAWASILSLPYALLSDSVPARKMGVYMGVFNLFVVIPQLVAASVLGFLLKTFFGNAPIDALAIGGVSLAIAALFTLRLRSDR
ncbi:MFS transporter [Tahibacter soli]|uniref:MFS transporter n=1 Tax=Tahibacter soli TaxID=2983605 RepID=A0A9X3YPK5_9GAMM|nr:MFS transporter [Tahibacter soli]MDC8016132.1 MFS transporter [Tahibacter soli]